MITNYENKARPYAEPTTLCTVVRESTIEHAPVPESWSVHEVDKHMTERFGPGVLVHEPGGWRYILGDSSAKERRDEVE